jgi:ATP-dependent protease ClpP protease subunit
MKHLLTILVAFCLLALDWLHAQLMSVVPRGYARPGALASAAPERPPVPSVLALSTSGSEAELLIYGPIGDLYWNGITAAAMVDVLQQLNVSTIRVRINSIGGVASEGIAIYNALKRHPARIVIVVDGSAESIASLVAMAGDEVIMPPSTLMMIHAPYTPQGGNSVQLRENADSLDTIAAAMAEAYIAKTGKPDEIKSMLADGRNHYFTAAQAVELGLADRMDESAEAPIPELAAAAALCNYITAIAHAPTEHTAALRGRIQAATTPLVFASLPEVTQRAVVAHIEDPTMKQKLETILAQGGGNNPSPATNPVTNPAPAAPARAAGVDTAQAVAVAITALRDRNTEITALAQAHIGNADVRAYVDTVIAAADPAVTAGDVGKQILAILAKGRTPINGNGAHVQPGADERDKQRTAMASAIEVRAYGGQIEGANPFRGFTMFELARACATAAGVNTRGMDRMDVVAAAFTTSSSDFPLLLGNTASKALKKGYDEAPEVFPTFTRPVTLTDFKPSSLAGLGRFSSLDLIEEGGAYKFGKFSDTGSSLKLVTYGKMFAITRQAIINDDLNALSDVPRKMGQAAKRTVGDAVFTLITSNPTLSDGIALFHASHNNLVGPGTTISTTSVDGLRVLMATQKDADGRVVRVPLKYIVVPVGLGGLARTVLESQFEVSGAKNLTTPNIVRNSFEVVEDPRLDAASATAWYGVADPNLFDGIVVGYLDGKQEPYLEAKDGWSVDGTEWKVRIDAAAAVADPIGLSKNPGA